MKKTVLSLFFVLSGYGIAYSQASKAVFVELGGPGIITSANYDFRFSSKNDGWGGRIGIGGFSIYGVGLLTVPLGVNYLISNDGKNYFEMGAGYTHLSGGVTGRTLFDSSLGTLSIGYRRMPEKSGVMFKAEITPLFRSNFLFPYFGGFGIGYKF